MNELELRASRARIVAARDAARQNIERMIHDGPQQHLVAIAVQLRLAETAIDEDPEQAKATLVELRSEVQKTIQHLRDLAHSIYPPLLVDCGLGEALSAAAGRASSAVDLTVAGEGRYHAEIEAAVYFSVIEAIDAAAGPLTIWVGEEDANLIFEVRGPLRDGSVLLNIADRIDTMEGSLNTEPTDDGSLHLRGLVPLG